MNRICVAVALLAVPLILAAAPDSEKDARGGDAGKLVFSWSRSQMNGSRTGVGCPGAENVREAVGHVKGNVYFSPCGKIYRGGATAKAARILIGAQPAMAQVKEVVGYSPRPMVNAYPESTLSNWFIDNIMSAVEKASGKHVDVGIGNFGGIRVDMPEGDILKDDIMSMFPFKNNIVYVALKGKDVRAILDQMAATRFQVLGGVRVVASGGKVVSAEIDGEPLDDEKVYGVATITFLLDGGDDIHVSRNALEVTEYPVEIYDVMMDAVRNDTAAGRPVEYRTDGRVQII